METAKRLWLFLFVILFSVAGGWNDLRAAEVTYTGPPITIRYSSHVPESHMVVQKAFHPWVKSLAEESKGKLLVKSYFSGALHGPRDGFKACVNDITDYTHGYPIWQPASFELNHVVNLPFSFGNSMVATMVSEELYPKYFKKEYENMGVYLARYETTSAYHLLTKKPVKKLEELKGMKIRCPAGPLGDALKRLGATPIFLTTADAYTGFQRGVVDGAVLYDNGFVSFRLHEIGKYRTELSLVISGIPYCLNRKTFDKLPPDLKRIFYNSLRKFSQIAAIAYEEEDVEAREIMKKAGIQTITLPPQELERWKGAVMPIWDDFVKANESKGLPAAQLVKEMKARSQKYSSWTAEQFLKEATEHPIGGIIDGM